jgi:hypothetical protein
MIDASGANGWAAEAEDAVPSPSTSVASTAAPNLIPLRLMVPFAEPRKVSTHRISHQREQALYSRGSDLAEPAEGRSGISVGLAPIAAAPGPCFT